MEDSPDHLASVEQVGIYMLSNPDLSQYDTLLTCKEQKGTNKKIDKKILKKVTLTYPAT